MRLSLMLLLSILLLLFSGPTTVSRATYARLSSAGFPSIVDRRGNPPLVIDPKEELPLNLDSEGMDQLLGNEIIIQFLALSRCAHVTSTEVKWPSIDAIY